MLDSPTHPQQVSGQKSSILLTHQLLLIITPVTCEKVFLVIKGTRGKRGPLAVTSLHFLTMDTGKRLLLYSTVLTNVKGRVRLLSAFFFQGKLLTLFTPINV